MGFKSPASSLFVQLIEHTNNKGDIKFRITDPVLGKSTGHQW